MKLTDEQFKVNLDSITYRDIQRHRAKTLSKQHSDIINAMTTKQYFKWHHNYFKGDLDYKSQALSILKSTRSKKLGVLCLGQIHYYNTCFGTVGLQTIKQGVVK